MAKLQQKIGGCFRSGSLRVNRTTAPHSARSTATVFGPTPGTLCRPAAPRSLRKSVAARVVAGRTRRCCLPLS